MAQWCRSGVAGCDDHSLPGSSICANTPPMPPRGADARIRGVARILPSKDLLEVVRGIAETGGAVWFQVTGISMNPMIREGDSVFLAQLHRSPRRGDVLLLDAAGSPVLHRVIRYDGRWLVTRGDAAWTEDAPVHVSACVGHALAVRRGSALVALAPTLRFGIVPMLRLAAWWIRVRIHPRLLHTIKALTRAVRALA